MASRLGHFALPLPLARSTRRGDNTSMTSAKIKSTAFTTIDLDRPGKQVGFVMIPHSPHDDAWGVTRVPIAVIANGDGPTVILEGGNHGDEYEGPITITELIRDLDPARRLGPADPDAGQQRPRRDRRQAHLAGRRAQLQPHLSRRAHAARSRSRSRPIVAQEIFPRGDAFLDLHSGGSSLDILPSAIIEPSDDPALLQKNIAAAKAFGAPLTVVIPNLGDPRTATACACQRRARHRRHRDGRRRHACRSRRWRSAGPGVRNVLAHLGVLPDEVRDAGQRRRPRARPAGRRLLRLRDHGRHLRVRSTRSGPR